MCCGFALPINSKFEVNKMVVLNFLLILVIQQSIKCCSASSERISAQYHCSNARSSVCILAPTKYTGVNAVSCFKIDILIKKFFIWKAIDQQLLLPCSVDFVAGTLLSILENLILILASWEPLHNRQMCSRKLRYVVIIM